MARAAGHLGGALKYAFLIATSVWWCFRWYGGRTSAKSTQEIYQIRSGCRRRSPVPLLRILRRKENYSKAWVESGFRKYFGNSVKVVLISLAGILALGAMAAYALAVRVQRGIWSTTCS